MANSNINTTSNTQSSTDKIVIKDLNGKYYLFEVPRNTINTTDKDSWIFNNPVFIRRLNNEEYQSWLNSGGFNTGNSGIASNSNNDKPITKPVVVSNTNNNPSTSVSEPWAFLVMATAIFLFSVSKKVKNYFSGFAN